MEVKSAAFKSLRFFSQVRHDDAVSTVICKDCHVHLEEFQRFIKWKNFINEKQSTLHGEFFQIQVKEERHVGDNLDYNSGYRVIGEGDHDDKIIPDTWGLEQSTSADFSMNIVKSELDIDGEGQEVVASDLLYANDVHRGESFTKGIDKESVPKDSQHTPGGKCMFSFKYHIRR